MSRGPSFGKRRARMLRAASSRLYATRALPRPPSPEFLELLSKYESTTPRPLNLSQLLSFGRPVTPDSVLASVSYVLYELPRRLATRVRFLETLPFIVGTNPYVAQTTKAFQESFQTLAEHPPVRNLQENEEFARMLSDIVQRHANDIPTMAKGFQESSRYMPPEEINAFLDGAIRNRISVRLIAEQHIALTHALHNPPKDGQAMGVVDTKCSPRQMIDMCGSFVTDLCYATLGNAPTIVLDGQVDATFAYIPVHLEYILTELLKNSFRATVEQHDPQGTGLSLPDVLITLSAPPSRAPRSKLNESSAPSIPGEHYLSMRIRDQGGGVSKAHMDRIFSYAFTTANSDTARKNRRIWEQEDDDDDEPLLGVVADQSLRTGMGTIAGLGYGLPMSSLYARYFGGSLEFKSLEGWGSDVFVKLRCLDEAGDSSI
ncbi:hypothetical protein D9611_004460 [Ephemerocybe angulata]|uniref:Protein-serine/threonine kinase n=1 Tax=Ephemerocybe angulata TaxID=980116 RepID=A0A8H5BKI7_9AGAR|nr:hypothetical protein D9611_004460 [Tulosesus angulatus]